ncbi:major facilitator superfamily MFS_1 [Bacteroides coprosuis DSM 18011]|uniref:Major facilitator superfamily MFS_1 n=1 Tax=Bacteroides coprosuis DSM 18011 TaxID=679937 RepID=F3ZPQ5_9BACE|nr:MFS transporter [Bacteroides coprosuis]EGJ71642.1 major facilitator superfamily MFS_1 [Bacteroides coprosuis DSM 18011]
MTFKSRCCKSPWFILGILITCFVPVVIDSTVLHMAIPPLTLDLKATGTEVLWMLDIYSLFMAGLLIPMGVLSDKVGHHKLLLWGVIIFAIASLAAGFSQQPMHLIFARILLAVGGAMIMPTTLAVIRQTFQSEKQRGIALGIWVVFANGGAAVGPLLGGLLIDYFSWRAIFFINIPILLLVVPFVAFALPKSISDPKKNWVLKYALLLIVAIIMVVYSIKTIPKWDESVWYGVIAGATGCFLLYLFYKVQHRSPDSMVDWQLIKKPRVKYGMLFTFIPMTICSGFELLLSQELQLVHGLTPTDTAFYIAPFFVAFAFSGALGAYLKRIGILQIIVIGLLASTVSFFAMSQMGFATLTFWLLFWLLMAGFGLGIIMLAASFAIMSGADDENAGAAGSLESISYELGVGLGVTFFGVLLSQVFSATLRFDPNVATQLPKKVYHSIQDALVYAESTSGELGQVVQTESKVAFEAAHSAVLIACSLILLLFTIQMSIKWYKDKKHNHFKIDK